MTMNIDNNNKQSYLYLDHSAITGEDTRPIVGYVANTCGRGDRSIAVPQYPVKASEIELLFKDIPYLDILADIDSTVREAVDNQLTAFARALGVTDSKALADLVISGKNVDKRVEAAYSKCCTLYYRSFYDVDTPYYVDDVSRLFEQWAAQKLKDNEELAALIKDGYLSPWGGQFYLTEVDKVLLYSIPDDDDGYTEKEVEDQPSFALFDVTTCIWQQIKAYYGITEGSGIGWERWAAERSYRDIMDAIAQAVWGFKDSTGFTPVREIKSL